MEQHEDITLSDRLAPYRATQKPTVPSQRRFGEAVRRILSGVKIP